MRLKLLFDKEIFGQQQKLWIDSPEFLTVLEFINYLKSMFGIKSPISIWLEDFFVHTHLNFNLLARPSEIFTIRLYSPPSNTNETCQKRPLKDHDAKMKSKAHRKEMKRNPKSAEFTGKKIKFDRDGKVTEISSVIPSLNVLSPAEEFDRKKSEWKIKPIPPRKKLNSKQFVPEMITKSVPVLPHELREGDEITFSTTDDAIVKVLVI